MGQRANGTRQERLKRMLTPQSAAFLGGASSIPAIEYCRLRGFRGQIYVVNPRRSELAGFPCYSSVSKLPTVPDMAYIAVPRENVIGVVRELSQLGVAGAVCNTSGFSEMQGGEASQRDLVKAAGDMPVIGPNCPGVANFADSSAFMIDEFGAHGTDGAVAVVSNGGAYISDMSCSDRALPLAYAVGLGNQAMVTAADIMHVVLDDDRVRAINLYMEGIADPAGLARAGLKAARKGIPVVVIKGGRTSAGRRAAQSHTASLAGDEIVASALFRRLGFIEVRSPSEALETLKMLLSTPRPKGWRTAFATSSGSYAVLGSDYAEANGLIMPAPSPAASADLQNHLPLFVHPTNPLDISSAHNADFDLQLKLFRAYLSDEWDLAVQVMCFPPPGTSDPDSWAKSTRAFAQAASERGLPAVFINSLPEPMPKDARDQILAHGVAALSGLEDGFRAVANAVRFSELAGHLAERAAEEILLPAQPACSGPVYSLDEAAAKSELSKAGLSVPRSIVVEPDQITDLDRLAYPVVVKALSKDLSHKSEVGAVALHLGSPDEARNAVLNMARKLAEDVPELSVASFLVEEMVRDAVGELLIGVRRVNIIGLVLVIGTGGKEAELFRDIETLLLPASRKTIADALRKLKLFALLDGWRGQPKGDVEAAVDAIHDFGRFAIRHQERLLEAEINPLIVCRQGRGAVAVDAVMRLSREG
ncbi:acetate--CoA ligase family protein [Mesorhizobium australafricanum]|uniref:Acetate--CoA ligase family protein n=1 Tax=Mesorhizobium australafricanum TaxID=3072311 RepID=A0ABU4X4H9_9HYPH|nr:acetate--CoA ligase family protein [Mesorhizobium sp. VK3E]MDX8442403.1 acetate--CoA ligase family protein [Mesorhizobium sp. VK3E]